MLPSGLFYFSYVILRHLRNSLNFVFRLTIRMKGENIMQETIIEVNHLDKQYMKTKVVEDACFEIKRGSIVGLIGPNGAGKTTIMKMIGGLAIPTNGTITIFGGSSEQELEKARSRMSFMIETPYAKGELTARGNLEKQRLQRGIPNKEIVDEVLQKVGLGDTGKKIVKKFSLGMKQRLGLANALMTKPEIMVLDEPVNGLDPEGIIEIRELLTKLNKEEKVTILISSHILSELSLLCTDYIFINHGKIMSKLSASELEKACQRYYHIHTDNDTLALQILRESCKIMNCDVEEDGSIRVYEHLDDLVNISKTLYEHGVVPIELGICSANLEQFYMSMLEEGDCNA